MGLPPRHARNAISCALLALLGTAVTGTASADAPFDASQPQRHLLPGVFCVEFPPGAREPMEAVFTAGDAIHLARTTYRTHAAYVVASTLPPGRDADAELAIQRTRARSVQAQVAPLVQTGERDGPFGPVLTMRMRDVAQRSPSGEFPLDLGFHDSAGGAPISFAASRLFVRGPDRIEVAIIARPTGATPEQIAARQAEVDTLADGMLDALQRCTATLPPRNAD